MKTMTIKIGLILSCLMWLNGCASAPHSLAPVIISNGCPTLTPCQLPPSQPNQNGDLVIELEQIEHAWASCAAQVDITIECQNAALNLQQRSGPHEKTTGTAPISD